MGLFSSKQYGIESITLDGQRVKSKAEKFIADYFVQHQIRYQYEKPAEAHFWIFTSRISKPDFYLLDYNVYVEYWGLLNTENKRVNEHYLRVMKLKMAKYHQNKIKFISIYPSNLENFDWIFRKKLRDTCGGVLPTIRVRNYCSTCGGKVKQVDNFCKKCGIRLE